MQFQELTTQEMEQVNGGTLCLLGGLVGCVTNTVGGLLSNNCNTGCNDTNLSVNVKLSVGICL